MNRAHRALRATVYFMAAVGIVAAIMRTTIVGMTLATPVDRRPELSAYDAAALDLLYKASQRVPGTPDSERAHTEVVRMAGKYVTYPRSTVAHMIPGILILVLAPFQFNRELRNRHRRLHRWTGRLMLSMVLLSAGTAIFFGVLDPNAPVLERPTVAIFSALFLIAAMRAFIAIRQRDIAHHREWMIRMIAMAVGIGTVRVVSPGVAYFVRASYDTQFVLSMWVGWLLSLAVAEAWIRHTRPAPIVALTGNVVV